MFHFRPFTQATAIGQSDQESEVGVIVQPPRVDIKLRALTPGHNSLEQRFYLIPLYSFWGISYSFPWTSPGHGVRAALLTGTTKMQLL